MNRGSNNKKSTAFCSMDNATAAAFCYAKATGSLKNSFIGSNANKLFSAKSLKELYTLVFGGEIPAVPEVMLAKEIEVKAAERFENEANKLFGYFEKPSPIMSAVFEYYRYENSGENNPKKDKEIILKLWNASENLPSTDRESLEKLFKTVISLRNVIWAMRLKVYYHFSNEEIAEHLIYSGKTNSSGDVLAREAWKILNKDPSNYDDWRNWKFSDYLNPHEEGTVWELDPDWVERSLNVYISNFYKHSFHKNPMSIASFVAWFRIKQTELDYIRTAAEGLRLSVSPEEVKKAAGYEPSKEA